MAVRGIMGALVFRDYNSGATLYRYQNHFPDPRTVNGEVYNYNSFEIAGIANSRDSAPSDVSVVFPATVANVDLVEAALANRYRVSVELYRWFAGVGLTDPTEYEYAAVFLGDAVSGESDFASITLTVGVYNDNTAVDLPWRKIPWTIVGPLSFRR